MTYLAILTLGITTIWSLWLFSIAVVNLWHRKPSNTVKVRPDKLAVLVVIPSHNEEHGIGRTLESVRKAMPWKDSRIMVIADHCSDNTASQALEHGVQVAIRHGHLERGKGAALDWFFKNYSDTISEFEYVSVIDADTLVRRNFLKRGITELLEDDLDVIQLHYSSRKKHFYSPSAHALELSNHSRQVGLKWLTGQALLKGNGMIFRSHVLMKEGYASNCIAEDLEFSYHLISKGYRIGYTEKTSVYGDMPDSGDAFAVQHSRWEGGRSKTFRSWFIRIVCFSFRKKRLKDLLLAIDLSVPPIVPLLFIMGTLFPLSVLTDLWGVWIGQILLICSYIFTAPRWHAVCFPSIKDGLKIGRHLWLKLNILCQRIWKGSPKNFVRTPRSQSMP